MNIKTYRARSLQQALALVRQDLGPDAAVLHTREIARGLVGRLFGRRFEVAASASVNVPSRLPANPSPPHGAENHGPSIPPAHLEVDYRAKFRDDFRHQVQGQLDQLMN